MFDEGCTFSSLMIRPPCVSTSTSCNIAKSLFYSLPWLFLLLLISWSLLLKKVFVLFFQSFLKDVTHPQMSHLYSLMPRCLFTWFLASPSWAVAKLQILHMKGLDPAKEGMESSYPTIILCLKERSGNFNKTWLNNRWAEIWFYITDHFSMPGM